MPCSAAQHSTAQCSADIQFKTRTGSIYMLLRLHACLPACLPTNIFQKPGKKSDLR